MEPSKFTGNNNGNPPGNPPGGRPVFIDPLSNGQDIDATAMLINYNERFKDAPPTLFRDEVIKQVMSVLIGKNKPNALLLGPAGTGKTRIVEELSRLIAIKDPRVPDKLSGMTVYELPLSSLVSGASLVGQLEERAEAIIEFAEDPASKCILFIDEIHQLCNFSNPTYQKIAQILKPALARGDMRVIGATTTQEAKDLMDDPAFNRRFSRVIVDELTRAQTVEILKYARAGFVQYHDYKVELLGDDMLEVIVEMAEQYKPAGSHRPDNALTLMDRSIGDTIVEYKYQEAALSAKAATGDRLATAALNALRAVTQIPINEKRIRLTALKLATGNSKPEMLNVDKLRAGLSTIKGQDDIIENLIRELRKHEMNLVPSRQPMTMLFIGPSGVGKTETTKIVAKETTGCPPIILNMTEYSSQESVNRIIGSVMGYVGSDSNMELPFDALESNPYQVILLDEFEKCDRAVQKLFMQVFDEGTLKTNRGNVVDFSRSIIIATTNAGHAEIKHPLGFSGKVQQSKAETSVEDLSKFFDTALLNRFKSRITFSPISKALYKEILQSKYTAMKASIAASKLNSKLPDVIPDDKLNQIAERTYVAEFGARPAEKAVEDFIYEHIL